MEESYLLSHIALPTPWVSLWSTAWQLLLMVRELYLVSSGCLTTSVSNMGKCKAFSLNSSKRFTHSITVELEKGTSCQLLCVWSKFPQQSALAAGKMAYVISHVQMAWKEDNVVSQGTWNSIPGSVNSSLRHGWGLPIHHVLHLWAGRTG